MTTSGISKQSSFDKGIYFQKSPFIPSSKISSMPMGSTSNVLENIVVDPLEFVSIPDLFFGENMTPSTLDISTENLEYNNQHFARQIMDAFPIEKTVDFKHVIYNLLVENNNNPNKSNFVQPCIAMEENGFIRDGFCFNEAENPEKKLPELYALHIRKARLEEEDINSVFVHDLYKFYLRASVELLSKYFEKRDKYTYLYEDVPLFLQNGTLEEAEERIRNMKTRARKKRKCLTN